MNVIRTENGDVQVARVVLEPLAQFIGRQKLQGNIDTLVRHVSHMVDCANPTGSKKEERSPRVPGSGVGRRIGDTG